jgi:8-oxo-dGTP diphosphatase
MRENNLHRTRASVIVLDKKNKCFLVMYRYIKGVEKYVLLGGGVEENESIEKAAVREIKEEANLDVKLDKKLTAIKYKTCTDYVFLSTKFSGEIKLLGEEVERSSKDNVYYPKWICIENLKKEKIPIYPGFIVELILKEFK